MTKLQWKLLGIGLTILLATWLIYPTFAWYNLPIEEREQREQEKDPLLAKILKLGLDLRSFSRISSVKPVSSANCFSNSF